MAVFDAHGRMVRAEIDPRVGGDFVITERRDSVGVEHVGRYLEIERPHRLVFIFAVPAFSVEGTQAEVEITLCGDGCELTLTHRGVLQDYQDRTAQGSAGILDGLTGALV